MAYLINLKVGVVFLLKMNLFLKTECLGQACGFAFVWE